MMTEILPVAKRAGDTVKLSLLCRPTDAERGEIRIRDHHTALHRYEITILSPGIRVDNADSKPEISYWVSDMHAALVSFENLARFARINGWKESRHAD